MRENNQLEFKEQITNTFLKTISAYANYNGGKILFGVKDDGTVIGLVDPNNACLDIENKINDSIKPQPKYNLKVTKDKVVELEVLPGEYKPYLYKHKAYKRNDSSTIEVDNLELNRLILEGKNMNYEELPCKEQTLTFHILAEALQETTPIEELNTSVLTTLQLYDADHGYNNAAALLADKAHHSGIDVGIFGDSISIIKKRCTLENYSILKIFQDTMAMYEDQYTYETIENFQRQRKELIPEYAMREAVANALIHRAWDVQEHIRIFMFPDRIEIMSPGGLPAGITGEEYLAGNLSCLRNPILGYIFYRLKLVEIFGTGIRRIKEVYKDSVAKPEFTIGGSSIKVVLPIYKTGADLNEDEALVLAQLGQEQGMSISELITKTKLSRSKLYRLLKNLENKQLIVVKGQLRGTKYYKA